jgi:hypothetical protein
LLDLTDKAIRGEEKEKSYYNNIRSEPDDADYDKHRSQLLKKKYSE